MSMPSTEIGYFIYKEMKYVMT